MEEFRALYTRRDTTFANSFLDTKHIRTHNDGMAAPAWQDNCIKNGIVRLRQAGSIAAAAHEIWLHHDLSLLALARLLPGEVVGGALKPEAFEIVEQGEGSVQMLPCSYITHH